MISLWLLKQISYSYDLDTVARTYPYMKGFYQPLCIVPNYV